MTSHYVDLQLARDPDFTPPELMGALYAKLHRALYTLATHDIGVSLPDHKTGVRARTLGDHLRLHGDSQRLDQLMAQRWLNALGELVDASDVQPAPEPAKHRIVRRKQFNTGSPSRVRRYARRHDIPESDAKQLLQKPSERSIALPYVQIASRSSGQRFALFIEHGEKQAAPRSGRFNCYGLSNEATVPWF